MVSTIQDTLSAIFDVEGLRTLVTGGGSGLGLAIAEVMVDCGAEVTVADVSAERLDAVSNRLSGRAGKLSVEQLDVSDVAATRQCVSDVVDRSGGLDVAFVNAGIAAASERYQGGVDGLDAGWDQVLAVNLTGAFATLQACAAPMRSAGSGRIVLTASTAGLRADPLCSYSYVAAKAAIVNLTRQAALELAPHGVRVNAIAPGPFHTNIGIPPGETRQKVDDAVWNRTIPLGRMGDPDELKGLALLLASPASSFITGAVIPIDGGSLVNYAR